MRGADKGSGELFSYVDLEKRVRSDHPLRTIRSLVNEALVALVESSLRSMRRSADRRSRRRSCFGRCCCRPSIRSARSGS